MTGQYDYDQFMKMVREAQAKLPPPRALILNGTLYVRRFTQFYKKRRTRSMKGK